MVMSFVSLHRFFKQGESAEEKASKTAAAREEKMRKVLSALAVLASSSGVSAERGTFLQLVSAVCPKASSSWTLGCDAGPILCDRFTPRLPETPYPMD